MSKVVLLLGEERFRMNDSIRSYQSKVDELNFVKLDMEEIPIQDAVEEARTGSFFNDEKVVAITNPIFLTGLKDKSKVEHQIEVFEEYLKEPSPSTTLLIIAPYEKIDGRKKISKLVKKVADQIDCAPLSAYEAYPWLDQQALALGVRMDQKAKERLLQLVGMDMTRLAGELGKMALAVGTGNVIQPQMVDTMVSRNLEQNVFVLVEHFSKRELKEALFVLEDLLKQKESPIKILALLTRQVRLMLQTKILLTDGLNQSTIAKELKQHPFSVKLAAEQSTSFSAEHLAFLLDLLTDTDYNMKTGGSQQLEIELFLTKALSEK
ncbi:DNA polymerase III subunit delta (plasmid) [Alkalihalophilus sp. As8PL]|uniref:DNA polymerase III subunit delta n=1 Tax=Alkalihalophilus sp. As8PL TaxID=3237103 RepID=A0AB39BNK6_9BACI